MAYVSISRPVFGGTVEGALSFVRRLREARQRYRVYRQTLRELTKLTDKELSDLGFSRAGLRGVARDAAYGR